LLDGTIAAITLSARFVGAKVLWSLRSRCRRLPSRYNRLQNLTQGAFSMSKRFSVAFVLLGLAFLASPTVAQKTGKPQKTGKSPFPDKALETAVRVEVQEPSADLTDQKLSASLFFLRADKKGIRDLTGLEKGKPLAEIKLSNNQIVDLKPLKELANLQSLDLAGNQLVDLTPLGGLTKLQYLELSNNKIAKIDSLAGLTSLMSLYLGGNQISDLAPLTKLTRLSSLSLPRNQIRDLAPLASVNRLMTLDLSDNQISDLAPLTKQTEVTLLMLERNKITDLTPLLAWAKADAEGPKRFAPYLRLYLRGNPLSDAAKTEQLKALKGYGVRVDF